MKHIGILKILAIIYKNKFLVIALFLILVSCHQGSKSDLSVAGRNIKIPTKKISSYHQSNVREFIFGTYGSYEAFLREFSMFKYTKTPHRSFYGDIGLDYYKDTVKFRTDLASKNNFEKAENLLESVPDTLLNWPKDNDTLPYLGKNRRIGGLPYAYIELRMSDGRRKSIYIIGNYGSDIIQENINTLARKIHHFEVDYKSLSNEIKKQGGDQ